MCLNDEDLRRSYQEFARQSDRSDCPSADALRHVAAGQADEAERLRLVDHAADCADCAREYRLIRELRDWADEESGLEAAPRTPVWTAWKIAAMAASVVLAVGLGWIVQQRSGSTEMPRAVQGAESIPAPREPAQGARLAQPLERFAWPAVPEATYRVVLYDFQSLPIWESGRLVHSSVELPDDVGRRLATPGTYYWRVFYERGVERGHSPLFHFEIVP